MKKTLRHITDIKSLDKPFIMNALDHAQYLLDNYVKPQKTLDLLEGKIVANLFFESSTRTRNSFEIAARRLGAIVISPNMNESALNKGESLLDTITTLEAMGVSIFIIRYPEGDTAEQIAKHLKPSSAIINAGGGHNQHPTQGLLDLLTIQQHKPDWGNLKVTIIGDIAHSRVANSLIDGLTIMGVPDIRLVAPQSFLPTKQAHNTSHHHDLSTALTKADVIVTLRQQRERWNTVNDEAASSLKETFLLTKEKLSLAKADAILMHPGPMNRGVEISSDIADGPQSVILQQVQNGVAMRMALMDFVLR